MSFHELAQAIRMRLEGVILISPKGDPEDSILAHHELAISEFLLEPLEVVGRHVVPRKHVQVLVLAHECMHTFYNELLVFSLLWFHLGQGHQFVTLCFRHQQLSSLIFLIYYIDSRQYCYQLLVAIL